MRVSAIKWIYFHVNWSSIDTVNDYLSWWVKIRKLSFEAGRALPRDPLYLQPLPSLSVQYNTVFDVRFDTEARNSVFTITCVNSLRSCSATQKGASQSWAWTHTKEERPGNHILCNFNGPLYLYAERPPATERKSAILSGRIMSSNSHSDRTRSSSRASSWSWPKKEMCGMLRG